MSFAPDKTNPFIAGDGLGITIVPTRFVRGKFGIANNAPLYSSMVNDIQDQLDLVEAQNKLKWDALFSVRNKAGQHNPVNGDMGRFALPHEQRLSLLGAELGSHPKHWTIPEADQGALFAVSI